MMKAAFAAVILAVGMFVWLTSESLPPVVASHFGLGGAANGFSGKDAYRALMLATVLGVPGLIASSGLLVRLFPPRLINLPNKQYWLAPERFEASLESLTSLFIALAAALAVFLGYVHWLVVRANAVQPPHFDEAALFAGLAVLGAFIAAWLILLYRRFGRAARPP